MSKLADYQPRGPAQARKVRTAAIIDLAAAAVVAMLLYPQPAVRQAVSGAGMPIWVFVVSLLLSILVVLAAYEAVSLYFWKRSPGMYLLDLGVDAAARPTWVAAALWGVGWGLGAVPALFGVRAAYDPLRGLAVRMSGLKVIDAGPHEKT